MGSSVYLGTWVNWSHGRINGLTLTVAQPWSDVLVASIALVVAFTGTQIWGIVCFAAFKIRQSAIGNSMYHQVQAALRHSCNSPAVFAFRVMEIVWSNFRSRPTSNGDDARLILRETELDDLQIVKDGRRGVRQAYHESRPASGSRFKQLFLLLALTIVFAVGLTTLSLLSAQAFKAPDNTALISSPYCGWPAEINITNLITPEEKAIRASLLVPAGAQYQTTRNYARSCYAEASDGKIAGSEKQCNTLVLPNIPSTLTMDKRCPFPGEGVCKTDSAVVESLMIQSRDALGINTRDDDQISAKKTLTCVPIDADQWATDWLDAEIVGGLPGDKMKGYDVGKVPGLEGLRSQYAFGVSNYSSMTSSAPYTLFWAQAMPGNESETAFLPRNEINVPDADLTLIAVSSRAFFDEPIPDPWFNLTVPQTDSSNGEKTWIAPPGWSFLACLERYQLCSSGRCSNASALYQLQALPNYGLDGLTPTQKAVADLVWKSLWAGQVRYALETMAGQILIANEMVMGSWFMRSSKIPANQWTIEAWNLANISLAVLQRRPSDYASPAPLLQEYPERIMKPGTDEDKDLCGRIRIRTSGCTSFRVLGLVMLALAAGFATLVNRVLPRVFKGRRKRAIPDWSKYNFYHLLMALCEARDIQPWGRRDGDVPVMVDGNRKFAM
ncbi:hypothetical protein B0T16DRAFT_460803 [Cercophora newfieldiana]|uniref:Uncharacterized protein n=1 Tax=Cercophora newfieldiana TaxID=92897 RepID=A0AA39XUT0_9PEZI|nr:hypothetical protein B0T16DRAFT_460803 [Cercophora newfieldiana]